MRPFRSAFEVAEIQLSRSNTKYTASRRRSIKVGSVDPRYPEEKFFIRADNPAVLHVKGLGWKKMRVLCGDVRTEKWDGVILIFGVNRAVFGGTIVFLANVAPRQDIC